MLKFMTDVSPMVGKGKNKIAALSPANLQSVTRVCQQQTFPYTGILLEFIQHTVAKKTCPAAPRLGFTLPLNRACWLMGTAALLQDLCGAVQEDEQSFLRINNTKNTSELKFLHPKLNPNLPKVQGCSGLRFSRVSGDLRNPFTAQREKQEAETVSPPGPFLQLSRLDRERLFWLQAQTGGTLLCSSVPAFSVEH